MIVAAHQPSYLPWLGYLDKLAKADVFVVMDDLQYEAQNFQNRNRLKLDKGPQWVTVPLVRATQTDRVCDRRIDNAGRGGRHHWQRRTWRTLEVHYGNTPGFERHAPELEDVFVRRWESLVELDLHMLDLARRWLGIKTPILRASSLGLSGAKTDRIQDMCNKLGASIYLSGRGGSTGYLDTDQLARGGITTMWQHYAHPTYPQRYSHLGFVSHLGFLDLVLNTGPDAAAMFCGASQQLQLQKGQS
ncbi:MAG: WbqC family protein [Deltaproteobacteria bacterium]|nr:WbqC family protein [Deltaproteobacteria bacterium]